MFGTKQKRKKLGRRGAVTDILVLAIILLVASVVILFGYRFMTDINTQIQASDIIPTRAKDASTTLTGQYPGVIDNSFLFLAIMGGCVILILAALVRVHPIFIPIFLIALLIFIFVSGIFSNIYQEMASTEALQTQADQLTFISTILEMLPYFLGVFGFILMAVMYKLWNVNQ